MENLDKYTQIELQKMGNNVMLEHEIIKKELIVNTYEMEKLELVINENINRMKELENKYVGIVEKIME